MERRERKREKIASQQNKVSCDEPVRRLIGQLSSHVTAGVDPDWSESDPSWPTAAALCLFYCDPHPSKTRAQDKCVQRGVGLCGRGEGGWGTSRPALFSDKKSKRTA
jgi:hypothetical protein